VLYPGHKQSSGVVAVIVPCDRWLFTESLGVSISPSKRDRRKEARRVPSVESACVQHDLLDIVFMTCLGRERR